jgi:hypothetical protein
VTLDANQVIYTSVPELPQKESEQCDH